MVNRGNRHGFCAMEPLIFSFCYVLESVTLFRVVEFILDVLSPGCSQKLGCGMWTPVVSHIVCLQKTVGMLL